MATPNIIWSVRVDWPDPEAPPNYLEDLGEALAPFSASISSDLPHYSAQLTLEEPKPLTLRTVTTKALTAVENAARSLGRTCVPLGLEVLTWEQFEYRRQFPVIPELVGATEVAEMAGSMTRQRGAQLTAIPGFPPAVLRAAGRPLFVRAQVKAWLDNWERRTGRPPKPTTLRT